MEVQDAEYRRRFGGLPEYLQARERVIPNNTAKSDTFPHSSNL